MTYESKKIEKVRLGGAPARKKLSFLHVYYASFWYKDTQIKLIKLLKYTIKIVKILK